MARIGHIDPQDAAPRGPRRTVMAPFWVNFTALEARVVQDLADAQAVARIDPAGPPARTWTVRSSPLFGGVRGEGLQRGLGKARDIDLADLQFPACRPRSSTGPAPPFNRVSRDWPDWRITSRRFALRVAQGVALHDLGHAEHPVSGGRGGSRGSWSPGSRSWARLPALRPRDRASVSFDPRPALRSVTFCMAPTRVSGLPASSRIILGRGVGPRPRVRRRALTR